MVIVWEGVADALRPGGGEPIALLHQVAAAPVRPHNFSATVVRRLGEAFNAYSEREPLPGQGLRGKARNVAKIPGTPGTLVVRADPAAQVTVYAAIAQFAPGRPPRRGYPGPVWRAHYEKAFPAGVTDHRRQRREWFTRCVAELDAQRADGAARVRVPGGIGCGHGGHASSWPRYRAILEAAQTPFELCWVDAATQARFKAAVESDDDSDAA